MKANCVNVLNKTVSNVCKLENQLNTNTQNIEFLMKYINFNKNLLLSLMGSNVKISTTISHYSIDKDFVKNKFLKLFILGILAYLNTNADENYYILVESYSDIPSLANNLNVAVPSIIQVSLVQSELSELPSLLDAIKSGSLNKLVPIIDNLSKISNDPASYTIAILYYIYKSPEFNFYKESTSILNGHSINKAYEDLVNMRNESDEKIKNLFVKNINPKNILDNVNNYIRKGQEKVTQEYKDKSHNDPFYPVPTTANFVKAGLDIFLEENYLTINNQGELINIIGDSPFEPFSLFEPSEPSYSYFAKISDTSIVENQDRIESKIKMLLELTETETEVD